jgi:hypothetical protein
MCACILSAEAFMLGSVHSPVMYVISHSVEGVIQRNITVYTVESSHKNMLAATTENNALHKRGNGSTTKETYIKEINIHTEINELHETHALKITLIGSTRRSKPFLLNLIERPIFILILKLR